MTAPRVEYDTRPCRYPPCDGVMDLEIDGGLEVWACRKCENESYGKYQPVAEGSCQIGLPAALREGPPGPAPVFLGTTIGRRPE